MELLYHVVEILSVEAVLSTRTSCLLLHAALSTPVIWRSLADTLLRANSHVTAPPLFPRLGMEPSFWWLVRLLTATRCRFRRDAAQDRGNLEIPDFGGIPCSYRADVNLDGLTAMHRDHLGGDHRAELVVPASLGAVTLAIDMSDSIDGAGGDLYDHFIYLRRGSQGLACYWLASAGLHYLHLDRMTCRLERAEASHVEAGHRQASDYVLRPDDRLRGADPQWREGRIPAGSEQLYVGVTLYVPQATAALRQIVLR